MFEKYDLLDKNDNYLILAAKGLIRNKEYKLCQDILEEALTNNEDKEPKTRSIKFNLLAQCRQDSEDKLGAIKLFYECLRSDPYCVEAFSHLMKGHTYNGKQSKYFFNTPNQRRIFGWKLTKFRGTFAQQYQA